MWGKLFVCVYEDVYFMHMNVRREKACVRLKLTSRVGYFVYMFTCGTAFICLHKDSCVDTQAQ